MIEPDMNVVGAQETQAGTLQLSSTTLGENIDSRIAKHKDAIVRLERVRDTLRSGSILDVSMSDLQHAMRW
jgi:hypothetical protein